MKTKNTLKTLAAMVLVGVFSACSSEESTNGNDPFEISVAKQAEFSITSGGRNLVKRGTGKHKTSEENGLLYFKEANCPDLYKENFPKQKLEKQECEHVYACIKEDAASQQAGTGRIYEVDKNTFTYKAFYIVNAYSSKDHDAKGDHSDVAGDMHDLALNGVYITDFNTNTCVCADLVLADEGLLKVTYDDSFGVKKERYTVDDWKLYQIPGDDYGYYIGMDYHSAKEATEGDGDYSDWVIKVIPAEKKVDPVTPTNGEVEINLSVNDEHSNGDYVATKLSIHIRALTDVEVFLPVDKAYYCVADDMDISLSHKELDIIYNTEPQYVEMQIGGTTVTFKVQYEDAGIRVTTDGVNQEVVNYCAEHYADGITFEVWNYFKDITRKDLKPMLDQAQVTFLDNNPVLYVNAFAKVLPEISTPIYNKFNEFGQLVPYTDAEFTQPLDQKYWTRLTPDDKDYIFLGQVNPWDCTVTPVVTTYKKVQKDVTDPTLGNYNVEYRL